MYKLVLLFFFCIPNFGFSNGDWELITTNNNPQSTYANFSTLEKYGTTVRMWSMYDYNVTQKLSTLNFLSVKTFDEYKCREQTMQNLKSIYYNGPMGSGSIVYSDNGDKVPSLVQLNTVGMKKYIKACTK